MPLFCWPPSAEPPGTQLTHAPHGPGRQPCLTSCAAATRTTAASAAYCGGCAPPRASPTASRCSGPSRIVRLLLRATAHIFLYSAHAVAVCYVLFYTTCKCPHSHQSAGRGRAGQGRAAVRGAVGAQRRRRRLAARELQGAPRPAGLLARPRAAAAVVLLRRTPPRAPEPALCAAPGRAAEHIWDICIYMERIWARLLGYIWSGAIPHPREPEPALSYHIPYTLTYMGAREGTGAPASV